MHIMHVALGGCLKAPPVDYGVTQDTGGHIAYVLGAATAQARRNPATRVTIVTRAFDDATLGAVHARAVEHVAERVHVRRLRTDEPRYLTKAALEAELPLLRDAFAGMVHEDPPDVVHAHFADAFFVVVETARRAGARLLYTPHSLSLNKQRCADVPAEGGAPARLARETRAIREADAIVVSSEDEVRHQVERYDPSAGTRCVVVPPGISLADSSGTELARALIDPFLDDPERPFLLAIARPVPKKNLPALVDAYGRSSVLRLRANLVVVAGQHERIRAECDEQTTELDRLHALVREHGLGGRVALPPGHSPEAVTQLYRLAARRRGLFVNPARHEPFGLTLVEAARFGLPVVATRHGGPRDIVATLGHGRLVDPEDGAAISDACVALLGDRAAYVSASRGATRGIGHFSWDAWARSVECIVRPGGESSVRAHRPDEVSSVRPYRTGSSRGRHFLAFDIDDTLTGSAHGAERFRDWIRRRSSERLPYAVATGRELPEAIDVIDAWRLPRPDVWLTSVGSEIWRPSPGGELVRCESYAAHLSAGWDRTAVAHRLATLELRYQGAETQRPWKLSVFGDADDARRIEAVLAGRDGGAPLDVRVVASHGRFVDVLPARGGKAAAIEFEASRRCIPMARCVAAGNSGNDVDMLSGCGKAIVVANALPEIAGLIDRPGLYRASAPFALGVLEGLAAFDLLDAWRRRPTVQGEAA